MSPVDSTICEMLYQKAAALRLSTLEDAIFCGHQPLVHSIITESKRTLRSLFPTLQLHQAIIMVKQRQYTSLGVYIFGYYNFQTIKLSITCNRSSKLPIQKVFSFWLSLLFWVAKEGSVLFNDAHNTFYLVIWRQTLMVNTTLQKKIFRDVYFKMFLIQNYWW